MYDIRRNTGPRDTSEYEKWLFFCGIATFILVVIDKGVSELQLGRRRRQQLGRRRRQSWQTSMDVVQQTIKKNPGILDGVCREGHDVAQLWVEGLWDDGTGWSQEPRTRGKKKTM